MFSFLECTRSIVQRVYICKSDARCVRSGAKEDFGENGKKLVSISYYAVFLVSIVILLKQSLYMPSSRCNDALSDAFKVEGRVPRCS